MIINFKGDYKFQEKLPQLKFFLTNLFKTKSGLCPWTMSREPMDSADIVQSAWTLSRVSVDNVHTFHWVHGQCPGSPWTLSRETVENVHWVHGHCPVWVGSLDFVQSIHGHCPDFPLIPWKMSRESMDIVKGDHGFSGHFTDGFDPC